MEKKKSSVGNCIFCGKHFSKASIVRHLNSHLDKVTLMGRSGSSFHVKIENAPGWRGSDSSEWGSGYFLNVWVNGNAKLEQIDSFLRNIWLECCGHMSAFRFRGNFDYGMMLGEYGEISMTKKVHDVLRKDMRLKYEYDFGSTTQLHLTVVGEYNHLAPQPLVLLSRNEPLAITCQLCGRKSATTMCSICGDSDSESMFCTECAKKHAKTCSDFADYAAMSVVNSPRMGVCSYDGGIIDKERDRAWVNK